MRRTQSITILLSMILITALMLSACGSTESATKKGAEYIKQGDEFFRAGTQLLQSGETDKAEAEFQKAEAEYEKAVAEFKKALEEDPNNVELLTDLGTAYYKTFNLDEAIIHYEKALALAPEDASIHSNLAAAHMQKFQMTGNQAELNKALEGYQAAVGYEPDLAEAYFGLGVVYITLGRNAEAIQAFEKFQELDKGQDPIATDQAKQYLQQLKGQ